jgi:tripartite-type tricarboxylate transporter receptor subunit TctC
MMRMRAAVALAIGVFAASPCAAQTYPSHQIDLVVPFVAGGTTDTVARLIAQRLADKWGQPAVVNNRPGGGSSIGTALAAKAAPDGYTLLVTTIAFAINASLQKQPFDAVKDFAPITEIASIPLMLVVHNSLPVHNVKEFIEYSKAQPAGLDYATSGPGTSTHLAAEMFKTMTGAKLVHVPFKGNAEVLNALLGGHVKVHFALTASSLQHVRSGALRVLAVTTENRLPDLPDVPTVAELGYPGYEISSWQGVFAPAGTPKNIIDRLNGEIVAMLRTPEVQARIKHEGAVPVGSSPEQWSERFRGQVAKWAKVAQSAGLSPAHLTLPNLAARLADIGSEPCSWRRHHARAGRRSCVVGRGCSRSGSGRSQGLSQPRHPHRGSFPGRRTR